METFRTVCYLDPYGRFKCNELHSDRFSCEKDPFQCPWHSPNPGSGYSSPGSAADSGRKQTSVSEIYPAFVTWKTGKPSKMIFTREESQIASSPRHEMEVSVRVGRGQRRQDPGDRCVYLIQYRSLWRARPHNGWVCPATSRSPLYGSLEAHRFRYDVVYTNVMSSGAYRGYGATQGIYAVETAGQ